ncbi:MAG: hypothetical protein ABIG46_09020 [Candidatus Omnitrophota bacterium]
MSYNFIRLKVADIIIEIKSSFPRERMNLSEENAWFREYFSNFIYRGRILPHIRINLSVVAKLPEDKKALPMFVVVHPGDRTKNWRILKKGKDYIYRDDLKNRLKVGFVNRDFNRARLYILPKPKKGFVWSPVDAVYDFVQVILINYLSLRKIGFFIHGAGVRDVGGEGFMFVGKSTSGKTTLAREWNSYSKARVLNDDHIIVRRIRKKLFMYGSPWCGEYKGYKGMPQRVVINKLFFIFKNPRNAFLPISPSAAFKLLYPNIFPNFWDKKSLFNIVALCQDLVENTACFNLGLIKDKSVISFVRSI